MGRTAIVYGTRPEVIKLRSIIRLMPDALLVHVGQHATHGMMWAFHERLGVRMPDERVALEPAYRTGDIARMLRDVLRDCDRVICQGDTNTALAAALAAPDRAVHVEAGLRCGERMVEETNRTVIDHLAPVLFPPTPTACSNLIDEGLTSCIVTGNTGIDAFLDFWPGRGRPEHFLLTLHRPENVDVPERLDAILAQVEIVAERTGVHVLFPCHPRTRPPRTYAGIHVCEPLGYVEMLAHLASARAVFTDSGGLQEEACAGGVPCVTLRPSTERPESVAAGANIVVGTDATAYLGWEPGAWDTTIYGDGRAGEMVVECLASL